VPFVRFSRDRRGYVYVFLVDVPDKQARRSAPRVLYWFRTPPGLKVGRDPFDEATRAAIESLHPDLTFDWQQIANTPLPPVDVMPWRERRRQERAQKRTALTGEAGESVTETPADNELSALPEALDEEASDEESGADAGPAEVRAVETGGSNNQPVSRAADPGQPATRRRRRRGGRGRRAVSAGASVALAVPTGSEGNSPATTALDARGQSPESNEND
jgi:hypothetical protein